MRKGKRFDSPSHLHRLSHGNLVLSNHDSRRTRNIRSFRQPNACRAFLRQASPVDGPRRQVARSSRTLSEHSRQRWKLDSRTLAPPGRGSRQCGILVFPSRQTCAEPQCLHPSRVAGSRGRSLTRFTLGDHLQDPSTPKSPPPPPSHSPASAAPPSSASARTDTAPLQSSAPPSPGSRSPLPP